MAARVLRIGRTLPAFSRVFVPSVASGERRARHEEVPACDRIGVLSFLFSLRALLAEAVHAGETNLQKDMFWGIGIGGAMTILVRL
jgi:hypothetical protein